MKDKLLPCPFCGSEPRIWKSKKLVSCCNTTWITHKEWNTRSSPNKLNGSFLGVAICPNCMGGIQCEIHSPSSLKRHC